MLSILAVTKLNLECLFEQHLPVYNFTALSEIHSEVTLAFFLTSFYISGLLHNFMLMPCCPF